MSRPFMDADAWLRGDFDKRESGIDGQASARRDRILIAGALNDRTVLGMLGSQERLTWHDGRYIATRGEEKNPYRSNGE